MTDLPDKGRFCKATTKRGHQCSHWALRGSDLCAMHGGRAGPRSSSAPMKTEGDLRDKLAHLFCHEGANADATIALIYKHLTSGGRIVFGPTDLFLDTQEPRRVRILSDYEGEWKVVEVDGEVVCRGHSISVGDWAHLLREKFGAEVERLEVTFGTDGDGDDTVWKVVEKED